MNDSPSIYAYISMGLMIAAYLIPSILAWLRHTEHSWGIFLLNLCAGWVVFPFGWIGVLLFAIFDPKQPYVMRTVRISQGK